jgi:hypothetical protein
MTAATAALGGAAAPPPGRWRPVLALLLLALLGAALWSAHSLVPTARWTLLVFGAAIVAWTVLDWDETPVALGAAIALMRLGALKPEAFYAGLGDDFIWLLIGAFILAAVLQRSGWVARWTALAVRQAGTPAALFRRLTRVVVATAWLLPSTSGRAAVLLPVFLALLPWLPSPAASFATPPKTRCAWWPWVRRWRGRGWRRGRCQWPRRCATDAPCRLRSHSAAPPASSNKPLVGSGTGAIVTRHARNMVSMLRPAL